MYKVNIHDSDTLFYIRYHSTLKKNTKNFFCLQQWESHIKPPSWSPDMLFTIIKISPYSTTLVVIFIIVYWSFIICLRERSIILGGSIIFCFVFLQSSQASSWSTEDNNDIPLENMNTALSLLSNGKFSPVKHKIRNDINSLQPSSRRALKRKVTSAVEALLESLAPGQGTELMAMIKGEPSTTDPQQVCDRFEENNN